MCRSRGHARRRRDPIRSLFVSLQSCEAILNWAYPCDFYRQRTLEMNARTIALLERYAPPILGGVLMLLAWEFLPALFNVSRLLLPPPSSVVRSLWLIYDRGLLVENFAVTLAEALLGFSIGSVTAIFFAFIVTRSLIIER